MAIVSLISKAFYPPFPFSIAPVILLVIAPVEGIIQIIIPLKEYPTPRYETAS
jgi:hypothetical protein